MKGTVILKQMGPLLRLNTPLRRAVKFGVLSTITATLCAILDKRLWTAEPGVQPFIWNFSTLLDFALLDPLVIFFLSWSLRSMRSLGVPAPPSPVRWVSGVVGFGIMGCYYHQFKSGALRDAVVMGPGLSGITLTGWVVLFWTSLALSYVVFVALAQLKYLAQVSRLRGDHVRYQPLHVDGCAGFLSFCRPAWWFFNAMLAGLLIFVGFYFQDRYLNPAFMKLAPPETRAVGEASAFRLYAFWVYLGVATVFFIPPVLHLRRLMEHARQKMLGSLQRRLDLFQRSLSEADAVTPKELKDQLMALIELEKQVSGFPKWPMPIKQILPSAMLGPLVAGLPRLTEAVPRVMETLLSFVGLR